MQCFEGIPAHVGDFERSVGSPVGKTHDVGGKDAQTRGIALLARTAQELHPDADAQHGTGQCGKNRVEPFFAQLGHRGRRFAHARQNHPLGTVQHRGIGGDDEFGARAAQGFGDGAQIARIVVCNRYHRTPLLLGMS